MVNLVIACWGGGRRLTDTFCDENRGCFIESQIKYLSEVKHNLSQITFIDNLSGDQGTRSYELAVENIPDKIGKTPVRVHRRPNHGFSYGAFEFAVKTYWDEFDYYIFLEDDQIIIEDDFDQFLIEEFNRYRLCGYLCALVLSEHAAISFGITSIKVLKKVIRRHNGRFPIIMNCINYSAADRNQIMFSKAFVFGYHKLYDFSGKYKFGFIFKTPRGNQIKWYGRGKKVFMLPQQLMRGRGIELRRLSDVRAQEWNDT